MKKQTQQQPRAIDARSLAQASGGSGAGQPWRSGTTQPWIVIGTGPISINPQPIPPGDPLR